MSTLYKAPTINTVIEEMIAAKTVSVDYVDEFLKILNGKYTGSVVSYDTVGTYTQKLPAGTASKINRAFIYFNNPNPVQGMLFQRASGKDSTYWFIALGQPLCQIYKLSVDKVVSMGECLSVLEIRETIKQHGGTGGESEWERAIKPYLALNGTKIEVKNKKLFVGTSEQGTENSELQAYKITTNALECLDAPEGQNPSIYIIDDLRVGASGETKKIYLNGVELGGGTKVYRHRLTSSGVSEIALINTSSTPLTTGSAVMTAAASALMINAQPALYTPVIYWSVTGGAGGPVISYKYQNDSEIVSATWAALSATVIDTVYEI